MAFKFKCQNCGEDIIVKFLKRGEMAECKHCGANNVIPNQQTALQLTDRELVQEIRKNMESENTEELLKIWEENDREQYSEEEFEAVKQLLIERGETPPPQKKAVKEAIEEEITHEAKDKGISAFSGIGSLIGVMIGGVRHGIGGAVVGGVLGTILISSGIKVQIDQLRSKGKFRPFEGAMVVSYILAFILTLVVLLLAPHVEGFLTEGGQKPDRLISLIVLYVGPAFAGGIGALIPVWLSGFGKGR